jgi:hypothetical protein
MGSDRTHGRPFVVLIEQEEIKGGDKRSNVEFFFSFLSILKLLLQIAHHDL